MSFTDTDTEKTKERIEKSSKYPDIAYYLNLLILTYKIYFYHLEKTSLFTDTTNVLDFLKTKRHDFKAFILNKDNIKIYGAQLINYVYYLRTLGIIDLKNDYTKKFKEVFPDNKDRLLSDLEYSAKIYGMTHFILNASNYYQKTLKPNESRWITNYLKTNIDKIIARTEYDVIAEVGVCLLLTQNNDLKIINKIKAYLISGYNIEHNILPNKLNEFDFIKGEHRNILTIMLFNWPQQLTKIPNSLLQTMLKKGFLFAENRSMLTYGIRVPF